MTCKSKCVCVCFYLSRPDSPQKKFCAWLELELECEVGVGVGVHEREDVIEQ